MGLILLTLGIVLAFLIQESLPEEVTLDKWNPLTPSTLGPQNETGWAYMELTQGGSFLKLNVTASDNVRLMVGNPSIDNVTGEEVWANLIFNQVGTRFTQEVPIAGKAANCLDIKNEGTTPVDISGNVEKIGNVYQRVYPYSSLGALAMLVGFISLIYGIVTRPGPGRKHPKRKTGKKSATWRAHALGEQELLQAKKQNSKKPAKPQTRPNPCPQLSPLQGRHGMQQHLEYQIRSAADRQQKT
jgi:hypothetical protein